MHLSTYYNSMILRKSLEFSNKVEKVLPRAMSPEIASYAPVVGFWVCDTCDVGFIMIVPALDGRLWGAGC